ncbi:MAG: NADH-quinone oxidoreductase subunit C, partial [Maritimibacter sp.]|nr:NADH-quinone oxidoreductase subunit C [Maritimibacter sp.]
MTEALMDLGQRIEAKRPEQVAGWHVTHDELTVEIRANALPGFIEFLKTDTACRFTTLVDITAVDWPEREARFDVVYHLLSMWQNQRIRVKCAVDEGATVPSITGVHHGANWYEREVFDMFGILFADHPDMRRLLTDYGFR